MECLSYLRCCIFFTDVSVGRVPLCVLYPVCACIATTYTCTCRYVYCLCILNCVVHVGLGKASQGISTALSVEKTSKRGGKIVNIAAEQGTCTCACISTMHIC